MSDQTFVAIFGCVAVLVLMLIRVPIAVSHPSFVVLQRAYAYGYDTEYIGWVFNREELLDVARATGVQLEREFVLLPPGPIAGAPDQVAQVGFLFRSGVQA